MFSEYWRVLQRNPAYARLWLADVISLLGDWFSLIALAVLVSRATAGSGLAISGLLLAQLLPAVVVGPFAGTLVDRFDRKHILIISDLLRVAITIGFLFVQGAQDLWLVYLLTIAQFSVSSIFEPARTAMMPKVVRSGDLVTANVLSSITWSAMLSLGGLLGGVVAAFLGVTTALLLNSLSFIVSALLISRIRSNDGSSFRAEPASGETPHGGGLRDGVRYLRQRPPVAALLLLKASIAISNIEALRILYATTVFAANDDGALALGWLSASAGVGAVLGPLLLERFNDGTIQRMRRLCAIALAACALSLFGLASAPGILVAAFTFLTRAMGGSVIWTYSTVMIQQSTDDHVRGRVFALDFAANQLAAISVTLILGWLLQESNEALLRSITTDVGFVSIMPLIIWIAVVALLERGERRANT